DVYERVLPRVAEQSILPNRGQQDVLPAVVVVIRNGDAHAVHLDADPGLCRDVLESTVTAIPKESAAAGRFRLARPVGAIDQQQVLTAVVVDVEEGGPGTQRLWKVLLPEGAVVV